MFLRTLLEHHVAEGRITADELETGPLTMLDGTDIDVDAEAITFTSGTSVAGVADPATQLDIEASNGVVHAIDRILVPPGLDLAPPTPGPASSGAARCSHNCSINSARRDSPLRRRFCSVSRRAAS